MSTATKRAPLPGDVSKKRPSRARPKRRGHRKFGLPVQEAQKTLSMPLLQVDIEKAQKVKPDDVNAKENFLSCVIAQAATRAWGAERVAILRRRAYVAFPGEGHAKRYEIDPASRKVLEAWDRGEPVVEGVELRLRPPSKTNTLADGRARNAAHYAKHGKGRAGPKRKRRSSDPLHNLVRNGNLVRWA